MGEVWKADLGKHKKFFYPEKLLNLQKKALKGLTPLKSILPLVITPGGDETRRITLNAVTDFPEPLSPIMPRH